MQTILRILISFIFLTSVTSLWADGTQNFVVTGDLVGSSGWDHEVSLCFVHGSDGNF